MLMIGFQIQISGVRSNRSSNWATNHALVQQLTRIADAIRVSFPRIYLYALSY